jgi:hypothetical protein
MTNERSPSEMDHDQLVDEALRLSEHRAQTYLTEERRAEVSKKLEHVIFEIRYQQGDFDALSA